ncbi:YibL family ribosome-associated protein [Gilvimarinus agarilyticus]|uniref:YibL family ribosome-associated protein n=1 Tax=unclassified Gilvimarinus TaxID=2642066 RepID=UPI001C090186|nr:MULTISPECIES: YibL family ribosome-associated protein [unclassified Gilvimarinus]MBU2885225.1 YibL family ribosome-associated protein [Gilvimarinus agarilyticus]MDO6570122.1 YibL family ribosome-associated protein [Gilvimarinus sp. 2_MG-2023]MDO6748294.1 YibL family ribosome-associated protein [Gilvimarinus sp. 1_MG-2023]
MKLQQSIQNLNNTLDKSRRKLAAAKARGDEIMAKQLQNDIRKLESELAANNEIKTRQADQTALDIKNMPFNRPLTKQEQADMGKLKKSVKGLVVVHPLTAVGKKMGVKVVTGFAPKAF